jgi:glyoxylase I family protein
MAEIGGIEHLNLSVRDIRKSTASYMELLGLEKAWEEDSEEHGWIKIGLCHPASQMRLNFTEHRSGSGEAFSEFRTGMDHVAFRVTGGRAALEAWLARLEERGVEHSPIKEAGYGEVITLRDPDNIQLELYAPAE